MLVEIELKMHRYIAHPFWPVTSACINIEKKSGVNRQRTEEKRVAALKAECQKQDITYDRYLEMKEEAKEQFYRREPGGEIVIPRHQLAGAFVQTIGQSPKALRGPYTKDNFRSQVDIGDFATGLTVASGTFLRLVKLDTSHQRPWQENAFIGQYLDKGEPFIAKGKLDVHDARQVKVVEALLKVVVGDVGVGASRKMGFGRGKILVFKPVA